MSSWWTSARSKASTKTVGCGDEFAGDTSAAIPAPRGSRVKGTPHEEQIPFEFLALELLSKAPPEVAARLLEALHGSSTGLATSASDRIEKCPKKTERSVPSYVPRKLDAAAQTTACVSVQRNDVAVQTHAPGALCRGSFYAFFKVASAILASFLLGLICSPVLVDAFGQPMSLTSHLLASHSEPSSNCAAPIRVEAVGSGACPGADVGSRHVSEGDGGKAKDTGGIDCAEGSCTSPPAKIPILAARCASRRPDGGCAEWML
eukprot:TRINITY_DN51002_c0_g1_i1.p1 TRINITY_DN51002_c0_g1~~TRINITY_DN51002_c0_g1_i1.p1  ORF type:complete len:262 (+),score=37.60 TRINITY_DN51002_c0_g1_i1:65-850(+)